MITKHKLLAVPALSCAALLVVAGVAAAADGVGAAELIPVPLNGEDDGAGAFAVEVEGTTISFVIGADDLAPGVHAAHIHHGEAAEHECPTAEADANDDGQILTSEGVPFYGGIAVSLTDEGDTSPTSGLAVDRFAEGPSFEYERTDIAVSEEVAAAILAGEAVVVIHGVDADGSGEYDGPPSELNPAVPEEATLPALCGVVMAEVTPEPTPSPTPTATPTPTPTATPTAQPTPAPTAPGQVKVKPRGGVATGDGSTSGIENAGLIGMGAVALLAGGAVLARRRSAGDRG